MSMSTRSRKRSPLALVDEEEDNDVQVVERKETSYDRHKKPNELEYKNLPSFRKKCSAKQSKKPSLDVSGGDSVKEPDNNSQWNGPLSGRVSQPKQTSKSNLKFVPRLGPLSLPPCTATLTAAQPLKSGKRGQSNEAPVVIEHSEDEEEKKKNEEMEKRKQDILSPDSNCLLGIKAAGREYLYSTCENQCSSTEHISRNLLGVVDSSPVASPSCTYTSEAHKRDVSPPASLLSHSPSPSVVTKSPYFSQSTQGTSTHTVGLFGADRDSDDDFEHPRQYGSLPGSSHSSTLIEGLDYSNPSLTFLPRRPLHSKPDNFYGSSNGTSSGAPWLSSRRRSCTYMYEKKSKNPKLISKSGNPSKPPYATSATLDSIFTRTMRKPATRGHSTADLVVCISEDEEEKEEKVEEEKSTRRKKPNLKKEREEEAEELYKPSSSQTQSTRATKYVTRSSTTNPRLSTQRELNEEVALDVDIVRFGTLETTAIGDAQVELTSMNISVDYFGKCSTLRIFFETIQEWKMTLQKSMCVVVLLLSSYSGRGFQNRLKSRFRLEENFYDPSSCRKDERYIILYLNRSPDQLSLLRLHSILNTVSDNFKYEYLEPVGMQELLESLTPVCSPKPPSTPARETLKRSTRLSSSMAESDDVMSISDPHAVQLLYSVSGGKMSLSITASDLECLDEGVYLNDKIIDFYLTYLWEHLGDKKDTVHLFNSFFYARLSYPSFGKASSQDEIHSRVSSWTRHIDIFSKDYIIVPICLRCHWFIAVICYAGQYDPSLTTVHPSSHQAVGKKKKRRKITYPTRKKRPKKPNEKKQEEEEKEGIEEKDEEDVVNVLDSPAEAEEDKGDGKGEKEGEDKCPTIVDCTNSDCDNLMEEGGGLSDVDEGNESAVEMVAMKATCLSPSDQDTTTDSVISESPLGQLEEENKQTHKRSCIIVLDSLGCKRRAVGINLRRYLTSEWKVKRPQDEPKVFDNMTVNFPSTHLQDNSSDCGIFLLQYIENLFERIKENLPLPTATEWVSYEQTSSKRVQITDLILKLSSDIHSS